MNDLIKSLEERYTLHTTPVVATTVANGLNQISSGIYTEEERYIFELLQNAVDAFTINRGCLDVKIVLKDEHLIFMHNGDAFSDRDIKGLCDIGNGNKSADTKKIGYKGIGFKSVFMRSTCVTVETGNYCFKFDKSQWENFWDNNWRKEYGVKETDRTYLMPWQIIPIETKPPVNLDKSGYNVITYIQLAGNSKIQDKIIRLLGNSQFLLFLKSSNIKISYEKNGSVLNAIEKSTRDGIASLHSNGKLQNQWLIHTNDNVPVPEELMEDIKADIDTPDKLKGAKTFDLSFAIGLGNGGKLKKVDGSEAVVYTYLPTSYKFGTEGLPFLVNANFITDAGREQLHKDSVWNRLIFSKIPSEFLKWMSRISSKYPNYYEVLPKRTYGFGNTLEEVYAEEMLKAIDTIKFIPQETNPEVKLLAKEAVMDRMGITKSVSKDVLITHINKTYNLRLKESGFIATVSRGYRILEEYGVFIFGNNKIKALLEDKTVFNNITVDENIKLMTFLYDFQHQNEEEAYELNSILSGTKFLLDENQILKCPSELFFSTDYKEGNTLASEVSLLHKDIDTAASENGLTDWLSKLGIKTLSNLSFIEYLYDKKTYITVENAIEIGRFIFKISQKEDLFGTLPEYKINNIKFLSTKGTLNCASDLYLGSKFKPELDIEPVFDEDIFISDEYCEGESVTEWKVFFLKMGVKEDVLYRNEKHSFSHISESNRYDKSFFDEIEKTAERYYWNSWTEYEVDKGTYRFSAYHINYYTFSFLDKCDNYKYSKLVLSRLFLKFAPANIKTNIYVVGASLFVDRSVDSSMLTALGCDINHFRWVINNCAIIPTVQKECRKAKEVYSNAIPQIKDIAGDYLPVLDDDTPIEEEWQVYLGLKNQLTLEDYLSLLTDFSNDIENAEDNKKRISLIYQKLTESGYLDSAGKKKRIGEWSKTNRILSHDNKFRTPKELSYITLDGFASNDRVYIGSISNKKNIIELLEVMGVKIITETSIKLDSGDTATESEDLKSILTGNISPLALISGGHNLTKEDYAEAKSKILNKLESTRFYHCDIIKLTYGDADDVIERHTFAKGNEFYYIGDLRPANVEPLLTPLCKYLEISGKERELFVLMIEDFDGIRQNLKDKGYDVSLLEKPTSASGTFIPTSVGLRTESQMERDRITGFKGEIVVYEKLKSYGYNPVCPTISEKPTSGSTTVSIFGRKYYCIDNYDKYDMYFTANNGVKVFIEVKATTSSKEIQANMPISYRELTMIEDHQHNKKERYIIVRVFDINKEEPDIYCFDGQIINGKMFETN